MAKNIRQQNSSKSLENVRRDELVKEAQRQSESCLYTSTSFFEWLKCVRWYHRFFVIAPIVLGSLAAASAIGRWFPDWVIALLAFVASLFPALADGLKIQTSVEEISLLAAEFKALQDRLRQLTLTIAPYSDLEEVDKRLGELMDRMDIARKSSTTPPDWAFQKASNAIKAGRYTFSVDVE